MPEIYLVIMGMGCLLYYFVILLYAGRKAVFAPFWLALGSCFLLGNMGTGIFMLFPGWVKWFLRGVILAGIAVFLWVEGHIILGMRQKKIPELSYMIVLGARVNGTIPCRSLLRRIDTAAKYLQENPKTLAILSGGQGPKEAITEASAMKQCLLERGISEDRLLLEEKSTNTWENMKYSQVFLDIRQDAVGVVTNRFHIFRSLRLGKKQGYQCLYGMPAASDPVLLVNYMVREFFAVIKDKIAGNI